MLVLLSHLTFAQWEKLAFPSRRAYTLLQTNHALLAANDRTIYASTDNGTTWDSLSSIPVLAISDMIQVGNTVIVVSSRGNTGFTPAVASVFRSDDFCRTLDSVQASVYGANSIGFMNGRTYVNLDASLFASPDTGKTWAKMSPQALPQGPIQQVITGGNCLYLTVDRSLHRSEDNGLTWDSLSIPFKGYFYNVLAKDSSIYVGTFSEGFFLSMDQGRNWTNASNGLPDSSGTSALHMYGHDLIASISKDFQQSIYRLDLSEGVWHQFNDGFSLAQFAYINAFANDSDYVFLASDSSIWRRALADWLTSVPKDDLHPPKDFFVYPNYPNPFNPSTTLTFSTSTTAYVTLNIYDVLGRQVAKLFAGIVRPGIHTFHWSPVNCSSGIYFARFESGSNSMSRKLVLLK